MDTDVDFALARIEECWRTSDIAEGTGRTYAKLLNPMRKIARELGSTCIGQALLDAFVEEAKSSRGPGSPLTERTDSLSWDRYAAGHHA